VLPNQGKNKKEKARFLAFARLLLLFHEAKQKRKESHKVVFSLCNFDNFEYSFACAPESDAMSAKKKKQTNGTPETSPPPLSFEQRVGKHENGKPDDDSDITSKAAVALAAVAAAAVANNKSPQAAAKEARDLAQSFIQKESNTESIQLKSISLMTKMISFNAVRELLQEKYKKRDGCTATNLLLENDAFLEHLLLLEHYNCVALDDSATKNKDDSEENDVVSIQVACDRVRSLLKKIEGAYDSLVDMLPPMPKKRDSEVEDEADASLDDFEKAIVVPDLLPPCHSHSDLSLAFFRACQGPHEDAPTRYQTPEPAETEDIAPLDHPSTEPPTENRHNTSVFSSMFKRNSQKAGFFRKSKVLRSNEKEASDSCGESKDATNPGEYNVMIEREMLGLTVENVLERTVVRTVVAGGPAKKAGAKVGSLIVAVGNVETKYLTHFETIDELRQSNRPLQLRLRQISDNALRSAREEMGRLIQGAGFGTRIASDAVTLIKADLRIDSYTNSLKRRFTNTGVVKNKKEEVLNNLGEKLVWILTLFVVGMEREATLQREDKQEEQQKSMYNHTSKDYLDAAKSVSKVLLEYTKKKLDKPNKVTSTSKIPPPPPPPVSGRNSATKNNAANSNVFRRAGDALAHEKPLLQIGDVLQRVRTFWADPTSPPAALLRGEVISFLCDTLDIDTEMELAEEESAASGASTAGGGGINDLGAAGSLLKLIVLNCPIMRSPLCEEENEDDEDLEEEIRRRFGSGSTSVISIDRHRLHAGNRFLAVVHRLAASRSTSSRIAACSLGPLIWGHLDFPHQLQLRGVITRALHDVEVTVRKSTATVLHEIAELVFDSRCVPWLVLMCERAMTDPEPQLRSAAMTLTWHLAEHLPNSFLGDARQGSRYLQRLPSRDDPLFADVYLLQCKLLPVATRLAEDRSPSVRLAVAAQCDRLCDALGDHWSSVIIDVLLGLLSDSDERVRCEAVSCVPRLSEIVLMAASPGETASSEVSILEALFPAAIKLQKDSCVSVRVALATAAGELLTLLVAMQTRTSESPPAASSIHVEERRLNEIDIGKKYKMHVDDRLIPMVQALLNDADPEVTSASLRAVTNATRSSVQHSRARHTSIASTEDDASLSSYHSHASRGEKPVFLPVLSENQVLRLLPTLTELSDSRQWRVRQSAVEIVPALLGCTTRLETRTEISKLCVRLMGDPVDAVRKTAAECLCMGGSSLGSHGEDAGGEWITSIVIPVIRRCAVDSKSKQRLLSLKMVEVILLNGVCPNKWYATPERNQLTDSPTRVLVALALSLTNDTIANVRLNIGRVLESVLHVFEEKDVKFIMEVLHEQIVLEMQREGGGDKDVLYFAARCLKRAQAMLDDRSNSENAREEVHL
jgi:PDZ domain